MFFREFMNNSIILAALCSWLLTQVMKFFISWIVEGKASIRRLLGDGGMPSGHSATVVCTAVMAGYKCGFLSPVFGVAFILAIVVMHDATGVRRETGKQAIVLLDILAVLNSVFTEKDKDMRRQKLKTMVGHTPLQVAFGAILGLAVAILYIWIFGLTYKAYA